MTRSTHPLAVWHGDGADRGRVDPVVYADANVDCNTFAIVIAGANALRLGYAVADPDELSDGHAQPHRVSLALTDLLYDRLTNAVVCRDSNTDCDSGRLKIPVKHRFSTRNTLELSNDIHAWHT